MLITINMHYLNIIGLILNFFGTIIMAWGLFKTKDQIEKESGTYWGHNLFLKHSMYRDRQAAIVGMCFLAVGFLLQLFGAF